MNIQGCTRIHGIKGLQKRGSAQKAILAISRKIVQSMSQTDGGGGNPYAQSEILVPAPINSHAVKENASTSLHIGFPGDPRHTHTHTKKVHK